MWADLGLADVLAGHGRVLHGRNERRPRPAVAIPTLGHSWQPACRRSSWGRHWPAARPGQAITTVATWRGTVDPVERGRRYGLRRTRVAPSTRWRQVARRVEIALDIDPADAADDATGWSEPVMWTGRPRSPPPATRDAYRPLRPDLDGGADGGQRDVRAETRSGWFSSGRLLPRAAGRPGHAGHRRRRGCLPTGDGLLAFADPRARRSPAAEEIKRQPRRTTRAARPVDRRGVLRLEEGPVASLLEDLDAG